jgi:hypothetical protein
MAKDDKNDVSFVFSEFLRPAVNFLLLVSTQPVLISVVRFYVRNNHNPDEVLKRGILRPTQLSAGL